MSFAATRLTSVVSTELLCHNVIKQIIFLDIEEFFNVLFVNFFKKKRIESALRALCQRSFEVTRHYKNQIYNNYDDVFQLVL